MSRFHHHVSPEVFALAPGYALGVLVFDGCDNSGAAPQAQALLREAEAQVRVHSALPVAQWPEVLAWREAYRRFGAKPAEHRSSIEAMLRRVLKPDALPAINPLVDIGNALSLRHRLPLGVHPIAQLPREVALRVAEQGDRFLAAEGAEPEAPAPGEVVLACGHDVLTRRWTWRQSTLTRTLPDTRRVFFNIDALPPVGPAALDTAMRDVADAVRSCCAGRLVGSAVLTAERAAFECAFGG
ncbi:MAG: phenylalanine--tRNA ligase beta subunit-related protein [Burkholderiaceae bacterium]